MSDIHRLDEPAYESAWRNEPLLRPLTLHEQKNEQIFSQEQVNLVRLENDVNLLREQKDRLSKEFKEFYQLQSNINSNYRRFFLNYVIHYYEKMPYLKAEFLFYYSSSILWLNNRLNYLGHYNDPQYDEPWAFAHVNVPLLNEALQLSPLLEKAIEEVNQAKIPLDKELAVIKQQLEAGYNPDSIDLGAFKRVYRAFQEKFELARGLLLDYGYLNVQVVASRLGDKGSLEENIRAYPFALDQDNFDDHLGWLELLSKPIHL